jgi:methylglutaconyl-CoA hydratase
MLAALTISGPIATLTLNRPEQRNALSVDLLSDVHQQLDALKSRISSPSIGEAGDAGEIKVVVVTGAGKAFCAGMDLKQVLGTPGAPFKLLTSLAEACVKIRQLPAVTIASVNGAAIGGGCGLTTVCDFSITHAESKMGFPEVDLGVCPAVVGPWLVRKLGAGRARAMLLRGGVMSGQQALQAGLVSECVETRDGLENAVQTLAERLTAGGANALRATKSLLNELDGSNDLELARRSAKFSADVLETPEARAMLATKLGS